MRREYYLAVGHGADVALVQLGLLLLLAVRQLQLLLGVEAAQDSEEVGALVRLVRLRSDQ